MLKNTHSVPGVGIQTHNLLNTRIHPLPLDQGYCRIIDVKLFLNGLFLFIFVLFSLQFQYYKLKKA